MTIMPSAAPVPKPLQRLAIAMMAVSFLGFLDAAYLSVSRFQNAYIPCNLTHACDVVTTSSYATVLGIPVVVLGVIYYLIVLFGAAIFLEYKNLRSFRFIAALTFFGFLMSAWLVYVQLGPLQAICQYCMVSAGTSTLLFILGLKVLKTSYSSPSLSANGQE
jgi:uncharacterized membrane protein